MNKPAPARNTDSPADPSRLEEIARDLQSWAELACEAEHPQLGAACQTLASLLQIAELSLEDEGPSSQEMVEFVEQQVPTLAAAAEGSVNELELAAVCEQAQQRWPDMLELFVADPVSLVHVSSSADENGDGHNVPDEAEASRQIDRVLALLGGSDSGDDSRDVFAVNDHKHPAVAAAPAAAATSSTRPPGNWAVPDELRSNSELCDAFLDDACRCLQEMEAVALDTTGEVAARCQSFCRQLHTLKGAAASVGLTELATWLHEVEECLEQTGAGQRGHLDEQMLLEVVDGVRKLTEMLESAATPTRPETGDGALETRSASPRSFSSHSTGSAQSVRVRAAQLDRLMDMLADLVSIRNRREVQLNELARFNDELGRCAGRLRRYGDEAVDWNIKQARLSKELMDNGAVPGGEPSGRCVLDEVAADVTTIAREMAEEFQPLADENAALSRFIRQFRQELMQLRRLPVAGLFQRLGRAIHDAARAEGKQVEFRMQGEDTGLEQAFQERLFEPLLHMVRNAVSHGIESPEDRKKARKGVQGIVTLSASATASMLTIVVADDGRGLDYDALRRRGFERGLLAPGTSPSRSQLAKLIFHSGFSTRDSASQVSGRGVGMDVVATTIDRMQGRIEVDSQPGAGAQIRLSIPLTTGIEHVMVFRAGGELFALPMRAIHSADRQMSGGTATMVRFADVIGRGRAEATGLHTLMFDDRTGLEVDEVLGPGEVVVRPLPEMLRRHPLVSGVVLSAGGETVLLLNAERTRQWCLRARPESARFDQDCDSPGPVSHNAAPQRRALVVDDSMSARLLLARKLSERGFEVSQAGDGLAALEALRTGTYDVVFTDIDMPRMGGLELLGEIRQDHTLDLQTVVVSSRPRKEIWKRASRNGAAGYLAKPVSGETLDNLLGGLKSAATANND